ncbi:GerMN domain-containing protein [Lacrimispora sp. NSJ-141]|uniref:GerMN domain-containing protein n=1 Tax=Lientehia hominis TaxID=2897778 RepID=A0AAP2RK19_9FIRM|nr:GerMN domain-containing protein [Lientehia hominis]MCD2492843.1 GerMN domain-containing protein [Lientehia hominis]
MRRNLRYLLLLLAVVCGLSACGKKEAAQEELKDGEYYIYYTNQASTKLKTEVCTASAGEDVRALADFLLKKMQETPQNMELITAVPEEVKIIRTEMGDRGQLFVYFNAAYNGMEAIKEIMCRAAVVKTLTQIDGVDYVGFYINDQPLLDASQNAINLMSASSFVENTGSDTAELQKVQLTLYYADKTGTKLVETEKSIVCSMGISMENLVVSQLLKGGDGESTYDTLPRDASVLSVTVKKGICYVNFNSTFSTGALNVSDYIPIYSIVNSLTELPNINKVQISVEGASSIKFRDSISLEQPFERKMDYVDNPGSAEIMESETAK